MNTPLKQVLEDYYKTIREERATSIEAIQRFLTAIDQFTSYAKKREIKWRYLKESCRNKQIVHDVCVSLNNELSQKIYLPFDEEKEVRILKEQIELLI